MSPFSLPRSFMIPSTPQTESDLTAPSSKSRTKELFCVYKCCEDFLWQDFRLVSLPSIFSLLCRHSVRGCDTKWNIILSFPFFSFLILRAGSESLLIFQTKRAELCEGFFGEVFSHKKKTYPALQLSTWSIRTRFRRVEGIMKLK